VPLFVNTLFPEYESGAGGTAIQRCYASNFEIPVFQENNSIILLKN
jgi:hypothetical protein